VYKILTFDGGGIRGISQARLIQRIEEKLGRRLNPDLIAGTSVGSFLATSYDLMPPSAVIEFFQAYGPKIFAKDSFLDDVSDLWDLKGARYSTKPLKSSLEKVFDDKTLGQLKRRTLITSYDLRHPDGYWQPVVFHNYESVGNSRDLSLVSACLRSSAAPTYFPAYELHTDGGVWGNNPSASALAAACDAYVGRQKLGQVSLLSLGTGRSPMVLSGAKRDLGVVDWLEKGLIDILLDGNIEASHYYCRSFLRPSYQRLQWNLPDEIKLDDVSRMDELIEIADSIDLSPILEWLQGFWV
jgi:uncharacterized protein